MSPTEPGLRGGKLLALDSDLDSKMGLVDTEDVTRRN